MSKGLTAHEIWSREQRLKQHEQRMAMKKAKPVETSSPAVDRAMKDFKGKMKERALPNLSISHAEAEIAGHADPAVSEAAVTGLRKVVEGLQQAADAVPAKKPRGRPKVRSDEDRKAYDRELKRKKRAALREAK